MKIPNTKRKKALFIIDMQDSFIINRNKYIIPEIKKIIDNIDYDMIVYSIQYNQEESLWYNQIGWDELCNDKDIPSELLTLLNKNDNVLKVNKLTRSIWKGNLELDKILKEKGIEEIHLTGYETNDCVMASAYESFDLGYYTFVIEEACETRTTASNHTKAIDILNYLNLTNNSEFKGNKNIQYFKL